MEKEKKDLNSVKKPVKKENPINISSVANNQSSLYTNKPVEKVKSNKKVTNKINYSFILYPLIAIICIFIILTVFKSQPSSIIGKVVDNKDQNTLLNGVTISVNDKETFENNSTGGFIIQNLKAGKNKISFKKTGYLPFTDTIEVKRAEEVKITVKLTPEKADTVFKGSNIIVANSKGNSISITNLNNRTTDSITVGQNPTSVVAINEKKKIYVANTLESTIYVIDFNIRNIINKIQLPEHSEPIKLVLSSSRDKVYVLNSHLSSILVINTSTDSQTNEIKISRNNIKDIAINPTSGSLILLTNDGLVEINGDDINSAKNIPFENISPGQQLIIVSNNAYIINYSNNEIIKADLGSGTFSRFKVNNTPISIAVNSVGNYIYYATNNSISVMDSSTGSILKENINFENKISKIIMSNDNSKLFILSDAQGNISFLDTSKNEINNEKYLVGAEPKDISFIEN